MVGAVGQDQRAGGVLVKERLVLVQVEISKHLAVFHVVAVQQRIRIVEAAITIGIQEDAAGQCKVAVDIGVDVAEIVLALHHRVINGGVVQGEPGFHVRVDGQQLLKGGAVLAIGGRLELQQLVLHVIHGGIDLVVIPQRISGVSARREEEQHHHRADQEVGCPQRYTLPSDTAHLQSACDVGSC